MINNNNGIDDIFEVKLMDVATMAEESYCANEEDEATRSAQLETGRKCLNIYNALKGSIPKELQAILYSLDAAYGDQIHLAAHQYYVNGFKDALKILNVVDGSVDSNVQN